MARVDGFATCCMQCIGEHLAKEINRQSVCAKKRRPSGDGGRRRCEEVAVWALRIRSVCTCGEVTAMAAVWSESGTGMSAECTSSGGNGGGDVHCAEKNGRGRGGEGKKSSARREK